MLKCIYAGMWEMLSTDNMVFGFGFWPDDVECRCHLKMYIYGEHDEKKIILPFGMYVYK